MRKRTLLRPRVLLCKEILQVIKSPSELIAKKFKESSPRSEDFLLQNFLFFFPFPLPRCAGLFLEGASLDRKTGKLVESRPKVLYEQMPVIYIYAINTTAGKDSKLYECPIYRKPARYVGGTIQFDLIEFIDLLYSFHHSCCPSGPYEFLLHIPFDFFVGWTEFSIQLFFFSWQNSLLWVSLPNHFPPYPCDVSHDVGMI